MRFICPEHGEVKPKKFGYSYPTTGWCPKCGRMLDAEDSEIRVMSEDEAQKFRPGLRPRTVD